MAQSTRQLHFVVGTSLLTATLFTPSLGCEDKVRVNEGPEPPHVNEGPQPQPDSADAGSVEPDQPEPDSEPDSAPDPESPPDSHEFVNVGPEPEPEPKIVNTRPK